ncbi:MAG: hypothetical protein JWR20_1589 [Marmoricola sp.]|nr:hypothetical protein [Marmoricola sp.]
MSARTFLLHGLVAGLVAGLAAFAVAFLVGEPQVQKAVDREESAAAAADLLPTAHGGASTAFAPALATHGGGHDHTDGHDGAEVSRGTQRTWGLLTGSLAVGVALGGIVALVAALALGRLGRLTPRQSTATVVLLGFVSFALVPFWKYPANPPGVGSGDTIGTRTASYFGFVVISVVTAVAATVIANRVASRRGAFAGVLTGVAVYLVVVVAVGSFLPSVDAAGTFPADTLWYFRRASLATLATMWAVLGVVLTALVGRQHERVLATERRRTLAASL